MTAFNLPERTLYPSKLKSILFLLFTLVFVVIGIFMIKEGEQMGWMVFSFFGIAMIVFIINLFPQASYLKLDKQGFETSSLFRKHKYSWDDVGFFRPGSISGNKMVMFDYSSSFQKAKNARKFSSFLAGAEGALHDTFGMKAQDLADLMNDYKLESTKSKELGAEEG